MWLLLIDIFIRENEELKAVLESGIFKGVSLKGRTPSMVYIETIVTGAVNAMMQRYQLNGSEKTVIDCTKILNLKAWPVKDDSYRG